jgi:hypothetical protein
MYVVYVMYVFIGGIKMCNCRANCDDLAVVRRLRDRGIPVDEDRFQRMQAACAGLVILQDGPASVFDLSSGGTGCELYVVILNESRRPLVPVHIGFDGEDWATGMSLLPDPYKVYPAGRGNTHRRVRDNSGYLADYSAARNAYVFPIHSHPPKIFPRADVLNHRLARSCVLYPGESSEGWLLAVGQKPMPRGHRDGDRLKMRLTLFDQRNRFHRVTFLLIVQRSRREEPPDSGAAAATCLRDDPKPNLGQEE